MNENRAESHLNKAVCCVADSTYHDHSEKEDAPQPDNSGKLDGTSKTKHPPFSLLNNI